MSANLSSVFDIVLRHMSELTLFEVVYIAYHKCFAFSFVLVPITSGKPGYTLHAYSLGGGGRYSFRSNWQPLSICWRQLWPATYIISAWFELRLSIHLPCSHLFTNSPPRPDNSTTSPEHTRQQEVGKKWRRRRKGNNSGRYRVTTPIASPSND